MSEPRAPRHASPEAHTTLVASTSARTIGDTQQLEAIRKRLQRAYGQFGGVIRLLDEGASCEKVVIQMAAVTKAMNAAAFTLLSAGLKECLIDPGVDSDPATEKFEKLFLSLA